MCRHAESLYEEVDASEQRERIDKLEADIHEPAEKHRKDEGQNLVVCDRRAEDTY